MLQELFIKFDKACIKNDLYKVCTIGDCYVAMSFFNYENRVSLIEEI